jgi:hypothetical protein
MVWPAEYIWCHPSLFVSLFKEQNEVAENAIKCGAATAITSGSFSSENNNSTIPIFVTADNSDTVDYVLNKFSNSTRLNVTSGGTKKIHLAFSQFNTPEGFYPAFVVRMRYTVLFYYYDIAQCKISIIFACLWHSSSCPSLWTGVITYRIFGYLEWPSAWYMELVDMVVLVGHWGVASVFSNTVKRMEHWKAFWASATK